MKPAAFAFAAALLTTLTQAISLADELAAFGLSVNTKERPIYFLDLDGKSTRQVNTPFRAQGFGNDIVNLGLAFGDGHLWALGYSVNQGARPLYKIKPADGSLAATIQTELRPNGFGKDIAKLSLTFGDGFLWGIGTASGLTRREILKISPTNGAVLQSIAFETKNLGLLNPFAEIGAAYGNDSIWFLGEAPLNRGRPLFKVNIKSQTPAAVERIETQLRHPERDAAPFGMTFGAGHLWLLGNSVNGRPRPLLKLSPADGAIQEIPAPTLDPSKIGQDAAPLGLTFLPKENPN